MKKPFFAQFLENQINDEKSNQIIAGNHQPGNPNACDGPAGEHNPNCPPIAVTLKYPCDAADSGQPCH